MRRIMFISPLVLMLGTGVLHHLRLRAAAFPGQNWIAVTNGKHNSLQSKVTAFADTATREILCKSSKRT